MFNHSPMLRSLFASAAASVLGTLAAANQLVVSDTIPLQTTNCSDTLTIPQFNPAQGVLNSITLRFEASLEGQVFVQGRWMRYCRRRCCRRAFCHPLKELREDGRRYFVPA